MASLNSLRSVETGGGAAMQVLCMLWICFLTAATASSPYCSLSPRHTMCRYHNTSSTCGQWMEHLK